MKQVFYLFLIVTIGLLLLSFCLGEMRALKLTFGTISLISILISLTFFWLWQSQATPLALGMSISWAGVGALCMMFYQLQLGAYIFQTSDTFFLPISVGMILSGAIVHLLVIQNTFNLRSWVYLVPILGSLAFSFLMMQL